MLIIFLIFSAVINTTLKLVAASDSEQRRKDEIILLRSHLDIHQQSMVEKFHILRETQNAFNTLSKQIVRLHMHKKTLNDPQQLQHIGKTCRRLNLHLLTLGKSIEALDQELNEHKHKECALKTQLYIARTHLTFIKKK